MAYQTECVNCGTKVAMAASYCPQCGQKDPQDEPTCVECDAPIAAAMKRCSDCFDDDRDSAVLELTEDGLEAPDDLVGTNAEITIRTPDGTVTYTPSTDGLQERSRTLALAPFSVAPDNDDLGGNEIALSTPTRDEQRYRVVDHRDQDDAEQLDDVDAAEQGGQA